jgi:hypothetical protein
MSGTFYWIDIAIAVSIPVIFIILYVTRSISRYVWILFWVGCCIGATWEIPFYFIGPDFSQNPLYILRTPTPYPLFFLHFVHCFWDGGLLVLGYLFVRLFCRPPHFVRFRAAELAVLLVWGGLQELAVELLSTGSAGWAFIPRWWNPSMFMFNGAHITLMPQLIWVAAPIVFYLVALRIRKGMAHSL